MPLQTFIQSTVARRIFSSSLILFVALLCVANVAQAQSAAPTTHTDLSPEFSRWKLSMKSQLRRDTCAVFTVTGALEYGLSKSLDYGVRLSDEYLNWAANETNGDWTDGALFAELQRGFTKWGIAEEADMPYNRAFSTAYVPEEGALASARQVWEMKPKWNWIARDSANGLTTANITSIKRVLRSGWPVCAGGEHCMLIVAYTDNSQQPGGGTFVMRDYAFRRTQIVNYADAQRRFQSLLWIQFPQQEQ